VEDAAHLKGHPFGQSVGFLLSQLGFEVAHRFGGLMREVELEPRHFAVMRAISMAQGRSQNEVGETLHIPASSMVAVVDHLEERSLIERRPHPTDRRARLLYVTPHGDDVLGRAVELVMGLEQVVCDGVDASERQTLVRLLGHVADNLGLEHGVHPGTYADHAHAPFSGEGDRSAQR
jgi:DNA-binding MarR family transcriptional regulator